MGLFSTSGSDREQEVAGFPITSYMFYEKNILEGDLERKVDTYIIYLMNAESELSTSSKFHWNWFTRSGRSQA